MYYSDLLRLNYRPPGGLWSPPDEIVRTGFCWWCCEGLGLWISGVRSDNATDGAGTRHLDLFAWYGRCCALTEMRHGEKILKALFPAAMEIGKRAPRRSPATWWSRHSRGADGIKLYSYLVWWKSGPVQMLCGGLLTHRLNRKGLNWLLPI